MRTRQGHSPLDYARAFGEAAIEQLLVQSGGGGGGGGGSAESARDGHERVMAPCAPREPVTSLNVHEDDSAGASVVPGSISERCCLHGCHGRGRCVEGRCYCPRAWSGPDCGVPSPSVRAGNDLGIVYIGAAGQRLAETMPTRVCRFERCGGREEGRGLRGAGVCEGAPITTLDPGSHGIYLPPDVMLVRLLAEGGRVRARRPSCGALSWHPLYSVRLYKNLNVRLKWRVQASATDVRIASADGTRWIHEEHLDRGECDGAIEAYWPGDVVLTLWGDTECWPRDVHHIVLPPATAGTDALTLDIRGPSTWRVHDPRLVAAARGAYGSEAAFQRPRRRQLFFAGGVRYRRDHARACYRPVTPRGACRKRWMYSFGARQVVQALLADHPLVSFNKRRIATSSTEYHATLREFTWCLSMTGTSFCPRIADIVASGCIPVLIRPGHVLWPFEPELDYSSFAISVSFEEIPRLPSLLANMSEAALRGKRERLREVHRMFIWDDEYGSAYETTRERLAAMAARNSKPGGLPGLL